MLHDGDGEIIPEEPGQQHESDIYCACKPFFEPRPIGRILWHRPFDPEDPRHEDLREIENRIWNS